MPSFDIELDASGSLPPGDFVSLAHRAEVSGFGGVWKGETSNRDPIVLLSAAATATSRVDLGSSILHVLARSPIAAGMMASTLNELAGGRFIFGLGVANATLATWHGGRFARPLDMARDYIEIVRKTYAGERVVVDGKAFSTRDFRLAGTKPAKPLRIYLAALGPRMSRLAGAIADGVLINMANPLGIREIVDWVREGARAAGRDPDAIDIAAKVRVALSDDLARARDVLRPTAAIYTRAAGYREMLARTGFASDLDRIEEGWKSGGFGGASKAIDDSMLDRLPSHAVSSVKEFRERLDPYEEAGVTRFLIPPIAVGPDVAGETRQFIEGWASR